ncbi:MAG TPA: pitrilysin family protein [Caulobacteraceae bacterium]|jgi:zinc protease
MKSVLAAAVCALALSGLPAAAQPPARAAAAVQVPDIAYRERTLPNGLRVFTVQDRSTPNVAVQVFYGVGAKDDPAGRSGFAHLFEHLMFKRTRNMPDEMVDRLTEDVGGYNNATTGDDFTNYYEVVPANHVERILWAEAERMGGLVVDQGNFASERDVVKEELRSRVLANPYGRFFQYIIPQASFSAHPYARAGIGSLEDLDAATLDDVRRFHATYYRPDNAVLIVSGNFDEAALDRWVDRYFGPIERPAAVLPRVTAVEPARAGPRTVTGYGPNVPLPALAITYPAPPANHQDAAALSVLDAVLSAGESSRLYETLVYEQQLAQNAFSSADLRQHPGLFWLGAIMASGKSLEEGERALLAEAERVRTQPVTPEELAEAKTEFTAAALRERETNEGKAEAIGVAVAVEGDAAKVNTALREIQAVTAADVQRVARQYLDPEKRVVVLYLQQPAGGAAAAAAATTSPQVIASAMTGTPRIVEALPAGQRAAPPAVGPAVQVAIPTPAERTLANGLRVIVATDRDLPLTTARLLVRNGAEVDPDPLSGLALITAELAAKGAGGRSAVQIAEAVEQLGGSLSSGAAWDGSSVTLNVLGPNLEPGAAILADVVRRPTFEAEELERLRQQSLDALAVAMKSPGSVAGLVVGPAMFGGRLYDHPASGTAQSLKRITRNDVEALHRAWWRPDNATLILTGDVTPEAGFALAQRLFGDWARPAAPLPVLPLASAPVGETQPRVIVVDMPESGQAAVYLAKPGPRRSDPRYYTALVADSVLGGGYSARLNQEIRIRRGLSYGARSFVDTRRNAGLVGAVLQTKNESADEVVDVLLAEVERLGDEPATDRELGPRKAVLTGEFGRELETSGGLAGLLSGLALHGRPLSEINAYLPAIEAVGAEDVRRYADTALSPEGSTIIVVGEAKQFVGPLRRRFSDVRVIPIDKLNLDSPTLQE